MSFEKDVYPDRVFILRFWREDCRTWRVQVSNDEKCILGWAEGVEGSFDLLRSLLQAPRDHQSRLGSIRTSSSPDQNGHMNNFYSKTGEA